MTNPANFGALNGRLARNIEWFSNKDGSHTGLMTLAVDDNYRSGKNREIGTNFISTRIFMPKTAKDEGSWRMVGQGNRIAVNFSLSQKPYTDANGKTVYPDAPQVVVEGYPQLLDTKVEADRIRANRAAKEAESFGNGNQAPAQQAQAPQAATPPVQNQQVTQGQFSDENPFGSNA